MCCFTGHVSDVSATNIFARVSGDLEYLAYEMTFSSDEQTAMILPIPTPSASEDDVTFVALDGYSDFFRDLERHFEEVGKGLALLGGGPPRATLKVHAVGAFEASYIPRIGDFDRLDARYRIPDSVWQQLPGYGASGFVVFKLRPGRRVKVHPMAFSFRTRDPGTVFFPTVHVHDGMVHETASFDHILYTQNKPARGILWPRTFWADGNKPASRYLKAARAGGLVDEEAPCFQMTVVGTYRNTDIVVAL